MKRALNPRLGVLVVAGALVISFNWVAAQQRGGGVAIDADDIGGLVSSAKGPEAGVWVIAETTDLPTKFARMVVTDDQGRYVLPDLPPANYQVFVRGYGLVDSARIAAKPGQHMDLKAVIAPDGRAAAQVRQEALGQQAHRQMMVPPPPAAHLIVVHPHFALALLDHPLVELMATLPASYKVRGREKRVVFKQAFRALLPRETLAKAKHGFGLPTSEWLKGHRGFRELGRDLLLSSRSRQRGYFALGAVEELFRRHEVDQTPFYGDVLWSLLMLELWHQRHGEAS